MRTKSLAATIVVVAFAAAPLALAQTQTQTTSNPKPKPKPKPKKKGAKPVPSASVSAEPEPPPAPPPPLPAPEPAEATATAAETKPPPPPPPEKEWDVSDTKEEPSKRYYFLGLRYRGDVLPKFLLNLFVDRGQTIYSNAAGIELDARKDGFSTVFGLTYQNYYTGDMLFLQKGQDPQNDSYYSVVNSALSALYASVDLLWSVPIANHLDFEYGVGVGLGVIFGNLYDNWVYATQNGPYYDSTTNQHFAKCLTTNDGHGCVPGNHTDPSPAKVGNYSEPAGIAGPKPILFPMLNFPQLGLRYKPIKQVEARFGLGFSITGFWFGLSADYGLEQKDQGGKASLAPTVPGPL